MPKTDSNSDYSSNDKAMIHIHDEAARCLICADVYSNGIVDINDVTALIDKVLGKN